MEQLGLAMRYNRQIMISFKADGGNSWFPIIMWCKSSIRKWPRPLGGRDSDLWPSVVCNITNSLRLLIISLMFCIVKVFVVVVDILSHVLALYLFIYMLHSFINFSFGMGCVLYHIQT